MIKQQVKVFISSVFQGMYDEREMLASHVFPEIRERCRKRMIDFMEIDLRWGVTIDNKNENNVQVCLQRVDDA